MFWMCTTFTGVMSKSVGLGLYGQLLASVHYSCWLNLPICQHHVATKALFVLSSLPPGRNAAPEGRKKGFHQSVAAQLTLKGYDSASTLYSCCRKSFFEFSCCCCCFFYHRHPSIWKEFHHKTFQNAINY